jgi:nicotinate-nucleotide pyrophosphorylase
MGSGAALVAATAAGTRHAASSQVDNNRMGLNELRMIKNFHLKKAQRHCYALKKFRPKQKATMLIHINY